MSTRILSVRLALLLALLSPAAALAQTWSVVHREGAAVMTESSKLTFEVRNTGTSRWLSEVTFAFTSVYALESAEAPVGWTASINRAARRITFTANGGCPAATNNGLAPGASALFSARVVGPADNRDQTNETLVGSGITFGREHCNGYTFNRPDLSGATWARVGLTTTIQALPRTLSVGDSIVMQVVVENRSSVQQKDIFLDGPLLVGDARFDIQASAPTSMELVPGAGGVFTVTATAQSSGTVIPEVRAYNKRVSSQVARAPQVSVGALASVLDLSPRQAFSGEVVSLRLQVVNTSSETFTNIVPRAPVSYGTASVQFVAGPEPASVRSLAPGESTQFTWRYRVVGADGSGFGFRVQADAVRSGSAVSTDLVDSGEGELVLIRLSANPSSMLPGADRLVRYTVENRSTESILSLTLLKPNPSSFGTATQPAGNNPQGWNMQTDSNGYTWTVQAGRPALLPGGSLTVAVLYSAVGDVNYDTSFLHRMRITRNGNQTSHLETPVTVIPFKQVPEVQGLTAVSGDGRTTLIWNNPTEHSGVLVVRAAGAAPDTLPTPGTRYSAGERLGNAEVVFSDALSTVSRFVDTGVTNGTEYVYRVFNFDEHHRYAAGNVPTSFGLKARPQARGPGAPLWCYNVGLSSLNQPITQVGVGIFSAFNNSVIANLTHPGDPSADGAERWRPVALQGLIGSRFPVVPLRGLPGQYLLVGTLDGYMYAINAETGAVLWTGDGGQSLGTIQSFPVTQLHDYANAAFQAAQPRDLAFFATRLDGNPTGNKVIALDAATGQRVWLYAPGDLDMVSGGMMVDYTNNHLFVAARSNGNSQASLRILDTLNGQEVARLALGDIDFSVVQLPATKQALVTANDGTVSGVGLTSLEVEWSVKLPATPTSFARTQGRGFLATLSSGAVEYYLLKPQPDGSNQAELSWSTPVPGPTGTFVHVENANTARVYVGGSDGLVHELEALTGAPLKQVSLGTAQRIGTPTIDNSVGRLHVGTQDGRVCAFQVPFQ